MSVLTTYWYMFVFPPLGGLLAYVGLGRLERHIDRMWDR